MKTESILVINSLLRVYCSQKQEIMTDAEKAFEDKPGAETKREALRAKECYDRACRVQADFWREEW